MKKKPNGAAPNEIVVRKLSSNWESGLLETVMKPSIPKGDTVVRLSELYDFVPSGYVSFDRSGRIVEANLSAAQLIGLPRKRLIGMPFATLVWREDTPLFLYHLLLCRSSDSRVETELRLKNSKRLIIHARISSTRIIKSRLNGRVEFHTSIVDRTERKIAEEALREKEAELELIITQTPFMLTRCTRDLRYRYVSRAYADMLGRKQEHIAGKSIVATIGARAFAAIRPYVDRVLSGQTVTYEAIIPFKRAGPHFLSVTYVPDKNERGEVIGWIASMTDIGERKKAEEMLEQRVRERTHQLHITNKKLQSEIERRKGLEGEILSVSDREQQRLGQELHDGLCQHLTAVAFMTRSIALRLRDHRAVDAADIEKVAELVNEAAIDTRNLSRALHRVDVDAATLVVALQDLVDREIWRMPCRLEVKPSFRIDDDATAAHLFRIAREAVINANKHAHAREIVVRVERVRKEMVLRVIDDGIGLAKELKPRHGLGFHIMNYRAQLMGGRLEIDSPQTGGTRVSCYLPVHAAQSNKAPNGDRPIGAIPKNSSPPVAGDLTLRHLARRGAANVRED
jgi:PAS domain S-box-containing protein